MHKLLTLAALLAAAPLAAQSMQSAGPGKMEGTKSGAMAGMDHSKMAGMDHSTMAGMDKMGMMKNTPANPYAEAGMAMHHKMMVTGTDASETWTRQMIEHHRGAIAMSKIAVVKAADRETRDMAQKTIAMQEKDVVELQAWLKRHGKTVQ